MALVYFPGWQDMLHTVETVCQEDRKHNYSQVLMRRMNTSSSHFKSLLNILEKKGYLEKVPEKRKKLIVLTQKGETAARSVNQLRTLENV